MLNILVQYDNNGDNQVTSGARGIAYSCLLDCLCAGNEHKKGWEALQVKHLRDRNVGFIYCSVLIYRSDRC